MCCATKSKPHCYRSQCTHPKSQISTCLLHPLHPAPPLPPKLSTPAHCWSSRSPTPGYLTPIPPRPLLCRQQMENKDVTLDQSQPDLRRASVCSWVGIMRPSAQSVCSVSLLQVTITAELYNQLLQGYLRFKDQTKVELYRQEMKDLGHTVDVSSIVGLIRLYKDRDAYRCMHPACAPALAPHPAPLQLRIACYPCLAGSLPKAPNLHGRFRSISFGGASVCTAHSTVRLIHGPTALTPHKGLSIRAREPLSLMSSLPPYLLCAWGELVLWTAPQRNSPCARSADQLLRS